MSLPAQQPPDRVPHSSSLIASFERAEQAARQQGHRHVTNEHLLLALVDDPEVAPVLVASRVDPERLRTETMVFLGSLPDRILPGEQQVPLPHPDLVRMLEYASAAAGQSRRPSVTGAIVLAAIVGDGKTQAARLLRAQGLSFELTIQALRNMANGAASAGPAPGVQPTPVDASPPQGMPAQRHGQPQHGPASGSASEGRRAAPLKPVPTPAPRHEPQEEGLPETRLDGSDSIPAVQKAAEPRRTPRSPGSETKRPPGQAPDDVRDELAPNFDKDIVHPTLDVAGPGPVDSPGRNEPASLGPLPPQQRGAQAGSQRAPSPVGTRPRPEPAQPPSPPTDDVDAILKSIREQRGTLQASRAPELRHPPGAAAAGTRPGPDPHLQADAGLVQSSARSHAAQPSPAPVGPPRSQGNVGSVPSRTPREPAFGDAPNTIRGPLSGITAREPRPSQGLDPSQLVDNIPRRMRAGRTETVEVRIARDRIEGMESGAQSRTGGYRHDLFVTKAMTVRLRSPDGRFWIDAGSPETQWVENSQGLLHDEYAVWRWMVTPKKRGSGRLVLIVSARTIDHEGLAAETALPDQRIDIKIRSSLIGGLKRLLRWSLLLLIGAGLGHFGATLWSMAQAFVRQWTG